MYRDFEVSGAIESRGDGFLFFLELQIYRELFKSTLVLVIKYGMCNLMYIHKTYLITWI